MPSATPRAVDAAALRLPLHPVRDESGAGEHGQRLRFGVVAADRGGRALEVEEHHEQLHAAHPVAHRVVHLQDDTGAIVGETLDERALPQRTGTVEVAHRRGRGHVEHRVERPRLRRPHATDVVREIEVGIGRPCRRPDAQRGLDDALTQARDEPSPAIETGDELVPLGRLVEHQGGHDRRAQLRVVIDVPHQRVGIAERVLEPFRHAPSPRTGVDVCVDVVRRRTSGGAHRWRA